MSEQDNTNMSQQPSGQGALNTRAQAQIDALLLQMRNTTNPDEIVTLADQLKILAMQPADELHTFAEEALPDWAIHEEDQEGLNAFFNKPADRGSAETAFAIPRGTADVNDIPSSGSVSAVSSPTESVMESGEPSAEGTPASTATEAVPAALAAQPATPSADARAQQGHQTLAEEPASSERPAKTSVQDAPRRADFARFRCLYESQDGQLALYEDGEGHLTAVNTNRFI